MSLLGYQWATRPVSIASSRRMDYVSRMTDKAIESVLITKLRESPDNPRKLFGDMTDFARTIESQGMLQPIVARHAEDEHLEVVIGHRRFRAAQSLGWKHVPVIVRKYTKAEALAAMLVENEAREDVSAMELAEGYQKLQDEHGLSADEVAKRVGVSRASVYAATSLLRLPTEIRQAVLQGRMPADGARAIVGIEGERLQLAVFHEAMKLTKPGEKGPTSRAVIKLVQSRRTVAKKGQTKHQREAKELGADVAVRRRVLERLLSRAGEVTLTKPNLTDELMRLMATAHADAGGDSAREVFQRLGVHSGRLNKVSGAQLRRLIFELALAQWVALEGGEYNTGARVTAKACGLSLAELERAVAAESNAEALFTSPSILRRPP